MAAQKETRQDEIIREAAKLFKEKGYNAVTMRDIAKAMGIKAASLYNHINSKQDILTQIIITLAEQFTLDMKAILAQNTSCITKLNRVIETHIAISSQNSYRMACLNNDWMHLETQLPYFNKLRSDYENDFKTILKQGIDAGEIINTNPDVMMFSILTTLRSLYIWIPKKDDLNLQQLSSTLSTVLISGISKK